MVTLTNTNGYFGKEAGTALEYDFSQISWQNSGTISDDPGLDLGIIWGHLDISGTYDVDVGLTGVAHLDLGSMETSMDLDGSTALVTTAGQGAKFDSSAISISNFTIDATGPDAAESYIELGLHTALSLDVSVTAYAAYDIYVASGSTSGEVFSGNLIDVDEDFTLIPHTTLDVIGGLDGNILTVALGEYFEGSIDLPEFEYDDTEYQTNDGKPDTLTVHGESSPFATLEFGLASFLGLGPWGESVEIGFVDAGLEAGLFDVKLTAEANLVQDITVESEIGFSMTTTLNDDVITGTMGDTVTFDTPEGEGDFEVTIDYSLIETVDSIMSLKLNSFIDWKMLFGEAYLSIPSISEKLSFEFALVEDRIDLGELLGLSVSFELTHDVTTYTSDAGQETYTVHFENFVTLASGASLTLTTNQISAFGGKVDNTINGNDLANTLIGARGDDTINGNGGDDRLNGGEGNDQLNGGDGVDMVVYGKSKGGVTIDLEHNMAYGDGVGTDTLDLIEDATGSGFGDWILGNGRDNELNGARGNDTIDGGAGNDVIDGGFGDDVLTGGDGIDTLSYRSVTLGGVTATLGQDAFVSDTFFNDVIAGFENITGSRFADNLTGDAGANILRGGLGDDTLDGAGGDDRLGGGAGADAMVGGDGVDTVAYLGSTGGVNIYLNDGIGLFYDAQGDTFTGIENVIGSNFNDFMVGSAAGDGFYGMDGNDYFYGEAGDDTLDGGAGDDIMNGGDGDDVFYASSGTDFVVGDDGVDTIIFAGNIADYVLQVNFDDGRVHVTDGLGMDVGYGYSTEYLSFADIQGVVASSYFI